MGTGITGVSTFSGLVDQFELAAQYGVLDPVQERDLAEFRDHADFGAASVSSHLRKIQDPHGTSDVSHQAAVRFHSDGSRVIDSRKKTPALQLAGKDDEDANSEGQPSGGVRVVIELDSNGVRVVSRKEIVALLRAMRVGGLTASLGDFFSPIGSHTVAFPSTQEERQLQELAIRVEELDREVNEQHQNVSNETHDQNLRTSLDLMARLQIWSEQAMARGRGDPRLGAVFQDVVTSLQETVGHVLYHAFGYDFTQPGNFLCGNQEFIAQLRKTWNLLEDEVIFDVEGAGFNVSFALDDLAYHARLTGEPLSAYTKLKRDICELRYVMNWRLREEGVSSGKVADCMELSAHILADLRAVSTRASEAQGLAGLTFYYGYSLSHLREALTLVPKYLWITHVFASARVYGSFLDIADVLDSPDWQRRFPENVRTSFRQDQEGMKKIVLPYMARRTWISESVARRIKAAMDFLRWRR